MQAKKIFPYHLQRWQSSANRVQDVLIVLNIITVETRTVYIVTLFPVNIGFETLIAGKNLLYLTEMYRSVRQEFRSVQKLWSNSDF